ncbi:hypothetical protein HDV62DRAFT_366146 [Trichoderma sp. SZMC 28011]
MMDGSCLFWRICLLWDDGYFGTGSYNGVGFPVQCLVFVLYLCGNPFSNLRNGMALAFFRSPSFLSCHLTPYVSPLNQSTEKTLGYFSPLEKNSIFE